MPFFLTKSELTLFVNCYLYLIQLRTVLAWINYWFHQFIIEDSFPIQPYKNSIFEWRLAFGTRLVGIYFAFLMSFCVPYCKVTYFLLLVTIYFFPLQLSSKLQMEMLSSGGSFIFLHNLCECHTIKWPTTWCKLFLKLNLDIFRMLVISHTLNVDYS